MKSRRLSSLSHRPACDTPGIVRLWLLRILVPMGAHQKFIDRGGYFHNDTLAELFGLDKWLDPEQSKFESRAILAELRGLHVDSERKFQRTKASKYLTGNIARLKALVGLSETDCAILEFAVMLHTEQLLDSASDFLGSLSSIQVIQVLSALLVLPEKDVRASLSFQGVLSRSGLVSLDRNGSSNLRGKLDLLSLSFADHMLSSSAEADDLLFAVLAFFHVRHCP